MSAVLWLCFTLSGAAALGLELLWMRSVGLLLGATAPTAATVLACYFAGLGMGAALAHEPAARPVRRYGLLEIGAAVGTAWSVVVFGALGTDGGQRALAAGGLAARVLAVAVATLPAALCLGATLPALGQALVGPGAVGRRGALLYAVNMLGGVVGVAAMGFGLPAVIGVRASYAVVMTASALAGTLALAARVRPVSHAAAPTVPAASRPRLRAVAAGAGALGLGLEILWVRLFAQVLHNSVYSFAAVSLVFLLALAAGAGLAAWLLRRVSAARVAAGALLAAAVAVLAGPWVFVYLTGGLQYVGMRTGLGEYVTRIVGLAVLTAGPAALASGAVLPALWAAFGDRGGAARPLGELTAANTLGGIAGALAAGFVVLPMLGLRGGLFAASAAYVLLAEVVAPARTGLRPLGVVVLAGIILVGPGRGVLTHLRPGESLRATAEGAAGIVTVVDTGDDLQLRVDNFYVLGGSAAVASERRLGLIPLLLHPAPRHVAFVGMATGISASAGPALGVADTTVIELVPEVAAAAQAHFGPWNGALLDRPDTRLVVDDGRRFLAAGEAQYDVVVADLFIPWHAGAGTLYTREMFETVARRLAPGGLFCQWLPLYQLTREEFDVIARTFLAVFPHVSVWRNAFYPDRPVLALVGTLAPRAIDLDRVRARLAALPEWARDSLLAAPRGLLMLAVGDLTAAADLLTPGPINTDDRPVIEFLAPRMTRMTAAGDKDWFTGDALADYTEALAARTPSASAEAAEARKAGLALNRYALAARRGDADTAARHEAEVRMLVPEVVAAGDEAPVAEARRTLDTLRTEEARVRREVEAIERRLSELSRPGVATP